MFFQLSKWWKIQNCKKKLAKLKTKINLTKIQKNPQNSKVDKKFKNRQNWKMVKKLKIGLKCKTDKIEKKLDKIAKLVKLENKKKN